MLENLELALQSNSWAFLEAAKILKHIDGKFPAKGYVLFQTGYGPSGFPHIGTFGEVVRTTMVRKAFEKISNIPTKLFCISDDLDGLRKVPSNLPNPEMIANYLGMPLTSVPDPFGECASYGDYMNNKMQEFLNHFGFEYEFLSATQCYKNGMFDQYMIKVIEKYDEIMELMLPTFRDERRATYSPFMPICPKTGKVLQVPIEKISKENQSVSYRDDQGELVEVSVTKGNCKLQWKPDFSMRWCAFNVDFEMYGKEHYPNSAIYSKICNILGGKEPVQFFYELFLDETGAKISKSKGDGLTIDLWLKYAPLESILLYIYNSPTKAKRLHFDVIPKAVDEYLTFNRKFHLETDQAKKLANPAYHIHSGNVPVIETFGISFSLLLNLASVCNPDDKNILWGFISKYAASASPENAPYLDKLVEYAVVYYTDFIKANKAYLTPSDIQKQLLKSLLLGLDKVQESLSSEEIQTMVYDIGMQAGYDNLRQYFKELYQILLGQEEGPRLGSFIKLYGINETKQLITETLKK